MGDDELDDEEPEDAERAGAVIRGTCGRGADAGDPEPRPVVGSGVRALSSIAEMQAGLALLNRHRATVEGRRQPPLNRRRPNDEETDAALAKQLDALARRLRPPA